ncbi:MAG: YciI family protein [Thaumarchaeota archaeon]|nr:YciI family protein [Candidatus Calditenuaceae archaeon]MDW8187151.1 YciI family protein [Nitrososphaerota archaeon]
MPRYLVLLSPKAPEEVVARYRPAHLDHIRSLIRQGKVIIAGRFRDGTGGFFVIEASGEEEVNSIIAQDPYKKADLREFTVKELEEIKA